MEQQQKEEDYGAEHEANIHSQLHHIDHTLRTLHLEKDIEPLSENNSKELLLEIEDVDGEELLKQHTKHMEEQRKKIQNIDEKLDSLISDTNVS
jgi:hypothetical protein